MTIGEQLTEEKTISIIGQEGEKVEDAVIDTLNIENDNFTYYQIISIEINVLEGETLTLENTSGSFSSADINFRTDFYYDLPSAPTVTLVELELFSPSSISGGDTETYTTDEFSAKELFSDDLRSLNEDFPIYVESVNHVFENLIELDDEDDAIVFAEDVNAEFFELEVNVIGRSP